MKAVRNFETEQGELTSPDPYDMESPMSIEERIDAIGQDLLATGFAFMARTSRGWKIPKEDEEKHILMQAQFKSLQATWLSLQKMNRIGDTEKGKKKSGKEFNKGFLEQVKKKQSTIGAIQADTK